MQGHIYQITSPRYGNQPHLYVVVLEFSGNKDCIVVPAFSASGYMVNQAIASRQVEGYNLDQIVVTLDNGAYVNFTSRHNGWDSHWLVSDADRLPIAEIASNPLIGTMSRDGLRRITLGLLNYAVASGRFSNSALKKLRQIIET